MTINPFDVTAIIAGFMAVEPSAANMDLSTNFSRQFRSRLPAAFTRCSGVPFTENHELARLPTTSTQLVEKESRNLRELEHVGLEQVEQLF